MKTEKDVQEIFQKRYTLHKRCQMSRQLLEKYPKMIPLIVQKDRSANSLSCIRKERYFTAECRYFLSQEMPVMQLKIMIQKSAQMSKMNEGLFLFFGGSKTKRLQNLGNDNCNADTRMKEVYNKYKDPDGFLYATYSNIPTF